MRWLRGGTNSNVIEHRWLSNVIEHQWLQDAVAQRPTMSKPLQLAFLAAFEAFTTLRKLGAREDLSEALLLALVSAEEPQTHEDEAGQFLLDLLRSSNVTHCVVKAVLAHPMATDIPLEVVTSCRVELDQCATCTVSSDCKSLLETVPSSSIRA